MAKVTQSNNPEIIGKDYVLNKKGTIDFGVWFATKIPQDSVIKVKAIVNQHITKGAGGTLGGAAVGGLLFGGAGAIVGGLAGGNNKTTRTREIAFQLNDNTWFIVEFTNGFVDDIMFDLTQKRYAPMMSSPFEA